MLVEGQPGCIFPPPSRTVSKKWPVIGYSIPEKILSKVSIQQLRVYFTAENLCYWSPIKKHSKYIDPEAAFSRSSNQLNAMYYPWTKTYMFGIDITL